MVEDTAESRLCQLWRLQLFENRCANGLALDIFARAMVVMSSMFLGPALLELATQETEACDDCNGKVYGFRPTSLLANITSVSSFLGCIFLPFVGAVVDHTPYRRQVGAYTAVGMVFLKAIETTVLGPSTWFVVACLQVLTNMLYNFHLTSIYAYTSDLSPDAAVQTSYNTSFYLVLYGSTLFFLATVLGLTAVYAWNDVATARAGLAMATTVAIVCFSYAWKNLFPHQPALRQVPPHLSLWTCGFVKVWSTLRVLGSRHSALLWLLVAVAFADAAAGALISIATTYLKEFLDMNASQVGIIFLIFLISGIPGSGLAKTLPQVGCSPIHSIMACYVLFIGSTVMAALVLRGPEDRTLAYGLAMVWGILLGWQHPVELSAYVSLLEPGQEAEMMGIFILAGQILTWLPAVVFTILNELGVSMALGLASLSLSFGLALLALLAMGSYEAALDRLQRHREGECSNNKTTADFELVPHSEQDLPPILEQQSDLPIETAVAT